MTGEGRRMRAIQLRTPMRSVFLGTEAHLMHGARGSGLASLTWIQPLEAGSTRSGLGHSTTGVGPIRSRTWYRSASAGWVEPLSQIRQLQVPRHHPEDTRHHPEAPRHRQLSTRTRIWSCRIRNMMDEDVPPTELLSMVGCSHLRTPSYATRTFYSRHMVNRAVSRSRGKCTTFEVRNFRGSASSYPQIPESSGDHEIKDVTRNEEVNNPESGMEPLDSFSQSLPSFSGSHVSDPTPTVRVISDELSSTRTTCNRLVQPGFRMVKPPFPRHSTGQSSMKELSDTLQICAPISSSSLETNHSDSDRSSPNPAEIIQQLLEYFSEPSIPSTPSTTQNITVLNREEEISQNNFQCPSPLLSSPPAPSNANSEESLNGWADNKPTSSCNTSHVPSDSQYCRSNLGAICSFVTKSKMVVCDAQNSHQSCADVPQVTDNNPDDHDYNCPVCSVFQTPAIETDNCDQGEPATVNQDMNTINPELPHCQPNTSTNNEVNTNEEFFEILDYDLEFGTWPGYFRADDLDPDELDLNWDDFTLDYGGINGGNSTNGSISDP